MTTHVTRSITTPIRKGLKTVADIWDGPDKGLIFCWEQGREEAAQKPDLAERARRGELVPVGRKNHPGNVEAAAEEDEPLEESPDERDADETDSADDPIRLQKPDKAGLWKRGSLQYLAWWQGLRGENLNVSSDHEIEIVCPRIFEGKKGKMKGRKFRRKYTFPRNGKNSKPVRL
jgi:hypothetical protein